MHRLGRQIFSIHHGDVKIGGRLNVSKDVTYCIPGGAANGVFANDEAGDTFGSINVSQQQTSESESVLL
jgi:hypothetical protein